MLSFVAQRLGFDSTTQNNTIPQGDKSLSDRNPNPKSHNSIQSSPLPHQVPVNSPCQHDQVDVEGEEEVEDEEEEVEVLLCSPVPQPRVCENILDSMDTLEVEEEEEEDLSEIDVTGDEAE